MRILLILSMLVVPLHVSRAGLPFDCNSVSDIPMSECAILANVYSSTSMLTWSLSLWRGNQACRWQGVGCDSGHVSTLDLMDYLGESFSGPIPDLAGLSYLASLAIGSPTANALPPLNDLPKLTRLYIENGFNGVALSALPDLSGLTGLTSLTIDIANFSGSLIGLDKLVNLQTLDLYDDPYLSGGLPDLSGLTRLNNLRVDWTGLSGGIGGLPTSLVTIEITHNAFSGPLPVLAGLSGLRYGADFSNNQFSGSVSALPDSLSGLVLSHNQLSGALPAPDAALTVYLVDHNQFSGGIPDTPSGLFEFAIDHNALTGVLPESLTVNSFGTAVGPFILTVCGGTNRLTSANDDVSTLVGQYDSDWTGSCKPFPAPNMQSMGVYRAGVFYLRNTNTTGFADLTVPFGTSTSVPIVGDWTGSGVTTVGVYDDGLFSLRDTNVPGVPDHQFTLGIAGDQPLAGHWLDSMQHDGVGVFRPSNGLIYLKRTFSTGFADWTMVLGLPGDVGVAGDWNGDGVDSPGVYRPSSQRFYLTDKVTNGGVFGDYEVQLGVPDDTPVVGRWLGTAYSGVGVFRVSDGLIYLKNTLVSGYADAALVYGIAGDQPVVGHWSASGASIPLLIVPSVSVSPQPVASPTWQPDRIGFDG